MSLERTFSLFFETKNVTHHWSSQNWDVKSLCCQAWAHCRLLTVWAPTNVPLYFWATPVVRAKWVRKNISKPPFPWTLSTLSTLSKSISGCHNDTPKSAFPSATIKCIWRLWETGSKTQGECNSAYLSLKN